MGTGSRTGGVAKYCRGGVTLYNGDTLQVSKRWPVPVVIIVDGPYGLGSFPGDPPTPDGLADWYRPYVQWWSERSTPQTTLWLWNSEIGWAKVHPVFEEAGWRYRSCHVWDKGIGHIAGNSNGRTLRKFPVVTEVCVQYVREAEFRNGEKHLTMQEWLRHEWKRTRIPFTKANEACGVANAATRKYLTACHLWYYPPVEAFTLLAEYANKHGDPRGRPYFSLDGKAAIPPIQWKRMRSKFHCEHGVTNVWREPQVRNGERMRVGTKCAHMNQKPLKLIELIVRVSSDPGDVIWEPFGGLCTAAVASYRLRRRCYSSEILEQYYAAASKRLAEAERLSKIEVGRTHDNRQGWPVKQKRVENATLF